MIIPIDKYLSSFRRCRILDEQEPEEEGDIVSDDEEGDEKEDEEGEGDGFLS